MFGVVEQDKGTEFLTRGYCGMRVCKKELEHQRKFPNKPSKPRDLQLLEWDPKEELLERSLEGCFLCV